METVNGRDSFSKKLSFLSAPLMIFGPCIQVASFLQICSVVHPLHFFFILSVASIRLILSGYFRERLVEGRWRVVGVEREVGGFVCFCFYRDFLPHFAS